MLERFREGILQCAEILTTEDYEYFKSANTPMAILRKIECDGETLYLVILDEKYPKLLELVNRIKAAVKPEMVEVKQASALNDTEIARVVKIISILLSNADLGEAVVSSFSNTEELLEYYGITRNDGDFDEPVPFVDEKEIVNDDKFADELKSAISKYVIPECTSVRFDAVEVEQASSSNVCKIAAQEMARVCKSYESKIANISEDISSISEKATNAEVELRVLRKESLNNKEELVDKSTTIKMLEEKLKQSNSDLDIALAKIDSLGQSAPKNEDELLDNDDMLQCVDFMINTSAEEIKSVLIKFMSDANSSNEVKSPFVLQMFDYIMN